MASTSFKPFIKTTHCKMKGWDGLNDRRKKITRLVEAIKIKRGEVHYQIRLHAAYDQKIIAGD